MNEMTKGASPKTLKQSIVNGLYVASRERVENPHDIADIVQKHVKDYLAQKFTVGRDLAEASKTIWGRIFPDRIRA